MSKSCSHHDNSNTRLAKWAAYHVKIMLESWLYEEIHAKFRVISGLFEARVFKTGGLSCQNHLKIEQLKGFVKRAAYHAKVMLESW